jgi:outer membrane autotransporter protein
VGKTQVKFRNNAELKSNEIALALFARYDAENGWYTGIEGFWGQIRSDSVRYTMGLAARGSYKTKWGGFSINAGKLFQPRDWHLTPRLGLSYTRINFPGFAESGAGTLDQIVSGDTINSLELETGLYISRDAYIGALPFTPYLNFGLSYETGDRGLVLATRFAHQSEVPAFISVANNTGRTRGLVEFGADLGLNEIIDIFIDYSGTFKSRSRFHTATVGMKANW